MTCKKCGNCACVITYKNKTEEKAIKKLLAKYPGAKAVELLEAHRENQWFYKKLKEGISLKKLLPMPGFGNPFLSPEEQKKREEEKQAFWDQLEEEYKKYR